MSVNSSPSTTAPRARRPRAKLEATARSAAGQFASFNSESLALYRQESELLAGVVRALVAAVDAKDPSTRGHSERVAKYAVRIALEMRVPPPMLSKIYMAGLLHDVGKIGIDDRILRKTDGLTEEEFEQIRQHPETGYKILADLKQLADVLPAVLYHHERWNGAGYPAGLAGDEIPPIARIVAVADAYDAITSDRPYHSSQSDAHADDIMRSGSRVNWAPEVVEAYFEAKSDIEAIRRQEPLPSR